MLTIIWNYLKTHKTLAEVLGIILLAAVLFVAGMAVGMKKGPVRVYTVTTMTEDTVSKQKLVEALQVQSQVYKQLETAQLTIIDLSIKVNTKTHIVKDKDGTTTIDKETQSDTSQKTDTSTKTDETVSKKDTTTDNKTATNDTTSHTTTKTVTDVTSRENWYVGLTGAVNPRNLSIKGTKFNLGEITPGIEAKRRVVGPFWLGLGVDTDINIRLSAGFSF